MSRKKRRSQQRIEFTPDETFSITQLDLPHVPSLNSTLKKLNRDDLLISRRRRQYDRRRVYADDNRRRLPSEDFFGPIDRTYHDDKGKVVDYHPIPHRDEDFYDDDRWLKVQTHTFFDEALVSACMRRKERRQVLFANKKAGKGIKSQMKKHVWNSLSHIFCKD